MYTCANCTVLACANNEPEKMPKNCPMRNASVMEAARAGYDLPENHDFYVNCSEPARLFPFRIRLHYSSYGVTLYLQVLKLRSTKRMESRSMDAS